MNSYRIWGFFTALTRVTHMSGTAGNEALIRRVPVTYQGEARAVAEISGNSLRHTLIRNPGASWLLALLCRDASGQWQGMLTPEALNFLKHGGSLVDYEGSEDIPLIQQLHEFLPLYRLLGGTLPTRPVPGCLFCNDALLVCEENRTRLEGFLGTELADLGPLPSAESLLEEYQYVTGDIRQDEPQLLALALQRYPDAPVSDLRMIFSGQAIRAGAVFFWECCLQETSPLLYGALLWSLELWKRHHGVVGGQGARGHGRLLFQVQLPEGAPPPEQAMALYREYMWEHRQEALQWLLKVFPPGRGRRRRDQALHTDSAATRRAAARGASLPDS
jgi:hypothetical protein